MDISGILFLLVDFEKFITYVCISIVWVTDILNKSQNFKTISFYRNSELNKIIIFCQNLWTLKTKKEKFCTEVDMERKSKEQWRQIKLKRMGDISNVHNKIMSNKIFPISTLKMKINNKWLITIWSSEQLFCFTNGLIHFQRLFSIKWLSYVLEINKVLCCEEIVFSFKNILSSLDFSYIISNDVLL